MTAHKTYLVIGIVLALLLGGCKFEDKPDDRKLEDLTEVLITPDFCEVSTAELPTTCSFTFENIGSDSLEFFRSTVSWETVRVELPKTPTAPNGTAKVQLRIPDKVPAELAQITAMVHANTPKAQHSMRVIVRREQ
ncbi:MAG: hypothetical protein ACOCZ8_04775 [Bacteroidota bacterium]